MESCFGNRRERSLCSTMPGAHVACVQQSLPGTEQAFLGGNDLH